MNEPTEKNSGAPPASDRRRVEVNGSSREPGVAAAAQEAAQAQQAPEAGTQAQPAQAEQVGGDRVAQEAGQAADGAARPAQEDPERVAARAEVARLQQELEASRKRVDELARAFQGLNQDREEFKQRLIRERERMIDVEKGNVALMLLEGIDELDRCLAATVKDESPLAQGVRLIRDKLLMKVQSVGIERLSLVGKPFDPNMAEAVDMEVTTQPEDDQKVVEELYAGYRLKERIIRPARVKVAKYVKPAEA